MIKMVLVAIEIKIVMWSQQSYKGAISIAIQGKKEKR